MMNKAQSGSNIYLSTGLTALNIINFNWVLSIKTELSQYRTWFILYLQYISAAKRIICKQAKTITAICTLR